jgi:hypothetical protein
MLNNVFSLDYIYIYISRIVNYIYKYIYLFMEKEPMKAEVPRAVGDLRWPWRQCFLPVLQCWKAVTTLRRRP